MKRSLCRLRVLVAVLVASFGLAMLVPVFRQSVFGPLYDGVPLTVWQNEIRRRLDKDFEKNQSESWLMKAAEWLKLDRWAIRGKHLDFRALPPEDQADILESLVDDSNPVIRTAAIHRLDRLGLMPAHVKARVPRFLDDANRNLQKVAIHILSADPKLALSAKPPSYWLNLLRADSEIPHDRVLSILLADDGKYRKEVWARIETLMDSKNENDRSYAMALLANQSVKAEEFVLPRLRKILATGEPGDRRTAITLLADFGAKARPAVPDLIDLLSTPEKWLRPPRTDNDVAKVLALFEGDFAHASYTVDRLIATDVFVHPYGSSVRLWDYGDDLDFSNQLVFVHGGLSRERTNMTPAHALREIGITDEADWQNIRALANHPKETIRGSVIGLLAMSPKKSPKNLDVLGVLLDDAHESIRKMALERIASVRPWPSQFTAKVLERAVDGDASVRRQALETLIQSRQESEKAKAVLFRALDDPDATLRAYAVETISQQFPATPGLLEKIEAMIHESNANLRQLAVVAFDRVAPKTPQSTDFLLKLLSDPEDRVASNAFHALARREIPVQRVQHLVGRFTKDFKNLDSSFAHAWQNLPGWTEEEIQGLAPYLNHPDVDVRVRFLAFLTRFPKQGACLVSRVIDQLREPQQPLRNAAVGTLVLLQGLGEPEVARLENLTTDFGPGREPYRLSAIDALRKLGSKAKASAPTLLRDLDKASVEEKIARISALGQVGSGEDSIPILLGYLGNSHRELRRTALRALGEIHRQPKTVVPRLIPVLTSRFRDDRSLAVEALANFASETETLTPLLVKRLSDTGPTVRSAAAFALAKLRANSALPTLREKLKDPQETSNVKDTLVAAIAGYGAEGVPHLLELIREGEYSAQASQQLISGKFRNEETLAELAKFLDSANRDTVSAALACFSGTGKLAEPHVPKITALLEKKDIELRKQAINVMRSLGPVAKSAVPAVLSFRDDSDLNAEVEALLTQVDPKTFARR